MGGAVDLELVGLLERKFFDAWPGLTTFYDACWVMRLSRGYTKRANSVSFLDPDDAEMMRRLMRAEEIYARNKLPACFRITPLAPPGLDATLEARGYRLLDETLTMTMALSATPPDAALHVQATPDEAWLRAFIDASGVAEQHEAAMRLLLARIVPETSYLTLRTEDGDAGTALVVVDGDWAGIFDVAVRADLRGRGYGARLMRGVLAHAAACGARQAWLQVTAANTRARALYAALGFAEAYRYVYRMKV